MPKLTAQEQLDLNLDLANAIRSHKFEEIESLIAKGANPFAVLTLKDHTQPKVNLFAEVIKSGKSKSLKIVLDHARKIGKTINLGENIIADQRTAYPLAYPMNALQFAGYMAGEGFIDGLIKYALETGQDTEKLANAPIIYTDSTSKKEIYRVTFGSLITKTFGSELLAANFTPTDKGARALEIFKNFLANWASRKADQTKLDLEIPAEITWELPIGNLKALIACGLNVNAIYDGQTLVSLIETMVDYSKEPAEWDEFVRQGKIKFRGIKDISPAEKGADGKVFFYATITNKRGLHPVRFKITLDFTKAFDLVQKAADPALAVVHKKVDALGRTVSADHEMVVADHAKVANLSETLLNDARASLGGTPEQSTTPQALHCFNVLQRAILAELDTPALAQTRRFAVRATTESAFIAQSAQTILSIGVQSAPFGAVVAGVTGALVQEITQAYARKQIGGALDATEGLITSKVATRTATLMTAKAMAAFGENITKEEIKKLVAKVKAEIGNLHKLTNQAELTTYLFHMSTKHLPVPAIQVAKAFTPSFAVVQVEDRKSSDEKVKSYSTGSSPIPSGSSHSQHSARSDSYERKQWALAAFNLQGSDDESAPRKATAPKKKSMFDYIPGMSCMKLTT